MATTTTIYATKDTWLDGENTSTNNSGDTFVVVGQQTVGLNPGERANAVLAFDVSSLTPSLLARVNLKLAHNAFGGNTTRTCYVYRLTRDFVEAQATWLISETATNWTAADGGASDIATAESSANFTVGFRQDSDIEVDITDLVIDAVNRRSGTLYLWVGIPLSDTATTRGHCRYHSLFAVTPTNRPQLECITADRVVWNGGANDGNANTAGNWVGGVAPTASDHVIFNDGEVGVTSGYISCNSLFISEGYKGTIEQADGSAIPFVSTETKTNTVNIKQKQGKYNLQVTSNIDWKINIANCPTDTGRIYAADTGGKFETTVIKTTGTLTLEGDLDVVATGSTTKKITTSGNPTSIKALSTKLTVTNGSKDFVIADRSKMYATGGALAQSGVSYISDDSFLSFTSTQIDSDVHIMSGTISMKNNENANIVTNDIYVWKNGVFDPRTTVGAWNGSALDFIGGGKFVVDAGRTLTVS